jgi:hypothetical protein
MTMTSEFQESLDLISHQMKIDCNDFYIEYHEKKKKKDYHPPFY